MPQDLKIQLIADKNFILFERSSELKLTEDMFKQIDTSFGKPGIDLFASRINHQLPNYLSCLLNPEAEAADAFPMN